MNWLKLSAAILVTLSKTNLEISRKMNISHIKEQQFVIKQFNYYLVVCKKRKLINKPGCCLCFIPSKNLDLLKDSWLKLQEIFSQKSSWCCQFEAENLHIFSFSSKCSYLFIFPVMMSFLSEKKNIKFCQKAINF